MPSASSVATHQFGRNGTPSRHIMTPVNPALMTRTRHRPCIAARPLQDLFVELLTGDPAAGIIVALKSIPLDCGRVHRPAARACGLIEAVPQRQKPFLAECGAEEGNTDGKVVSGESRGHDQVRKTREIGNVRSRCGGAWGSSIGRRGQQWRSRRARSVLLGHAYAARGRSARA